MTFAGDCLSCLIPSDPEPLQVLITANKRMLPEELLEMSKLAGLRGSGDLLMNISSWTGLDRCGTDQKTCAVAKFHVTPTCPKLQPIG